MKFKQKDIIIVVLIVIIAYVIIKTGILNPRAKGKVDPTYGNKDGSQPTYAPSSQEYKNIATSVYDAFQRKGWLGSMYFDPDTAIAELNKLQRLSDADLKSVANAYSEKYSSSNFPNLKSMLAQEYLSIFSSTQNDLRDSVVRRMTDLNL